MPLTNIHLITDEHGDSSVLARTLDLLRSVPGPVRFGICDGILKKDRQATGDEHQRYLSAAREYRDSRKIPAEDLLLVVSGLPVEDYWYNSKLVAGNDGIVHSGNWERYFSSPIDPVYPVAYEIAAWALRSRLFGNTSDATRFAHRNPRGCFMDLCLNDSEVTLKMRTGDICPECQKVVRGKALPINFVNQILHIWSTVGKKLSYLNTADFLNEVSLMEVNFSKKEIYLPVYDAKVEMMPVQMAVYAWFLKCGTPGVALRDLSGDTLIRELLPLYLKLYRGANGDEARNTVLSLADPKTNSLSEIMSKIRKKFLDCLGSEQLAGHYFISKREDEAVHRIHLPEDHIHWVESRGVRVAPPWKS